MDKATALKRSKQRALLLLAAAAVGFVVCSLLQPLPGTSLGKAIFEAAMVGGLADWFAIAALFKTFPVPGLRKHSGLIPNAQASIATGLSHFVEEKFLHPDSLVMLIRRHPPSERLAALLARPEQTDKLARVLARCLQQVLQASDDRRIRRLLRRALKQALRRLDLSQSSVALLDALTRNQHHQALLHDIIQSLQHVLHNPDHQRWIAETVVHWLKQDYPRIEKALPSAWMGEKSAKLLAQFLQNLLQQLSEDPSHRLRQQLDDAMQRFKQRLATDPELQQQVEDLKQRLLNSASLTAYSTEMWTRFRHWLQQDLDRPDGRLATQLSTVAQSLGRAMRHDAELRAAIDQQLEAAAHQLAPELSRYLAHHIEETMRNWDSQLLAEQIELNVGPRLQAIRVNGTLVGGAVGAVLWLLTALLQGRLL